MTAVTMRADQVRKGDKISLGGMELDASPVALPDGALSETGKPGVCIATYLYSGDVQIGCVYLSADSMVTVERPDPDAELIEVMAKGAYQGWPDLPLDWDDLDENQKDDERCAQRAALAAAREAGLLPEVTP